MKTKLLLTVFLLHISYILIAQIIHVPADQPTIQAGINAANNEDTVLVAEDTYFENINFNGKAITVASEYIMDGDTSHISNTIIDGSQPADPDSGAVVTFCNGEDTASILNGLSITGGSGLLHAALSGKAGGEIACFNSGPKIMNNRIYGNAINFGTTAGGGGISAVSPDSTRWIVIENNKIYDNLVFTDITNSFGGGISCASNARIINNSIYNNHCYSQGVYGIAYSGGLHIESLSTVDSVIVKSNEIFDNILESYYCYGAGVYVIKSFLYFCDNIINTNTNIGTYCYGSAIMMDGVDGEIKIENNLIAKNINQSVTVGLTAIFLSSVQNVDSKVSIKENTINNNSATGQNSFGNAIWLRDVFNLEVIIDGNYIETHQSKFSGGFYARNSFNYSLTNNIFKDNTAVTYGGAINSGLSSKRDDIFPLPGLLSTPIPEKQEYTERYHPLIANNIFIENHAGLLGGAVYFSYTYDSLCPVFINNIFRDNTADSLDFEIHHNGYEELLISNNNIDPSRIYGNWDGHGNIPGNPGFIDTLFHIDKSSLCCHAGIDSVLHDEKWYSCPMTDYEGEPRPMPNTYMPDIGADEVDETTGIPEFSEGGIAISMNIYPNPFKTKTAIEFNLPQTGFVKLSITDFAGQGIQTVVSKQLPAGTHYFEWNAGELPAGIYFLRLQTNRLSESRKLLLLK